MIDPKKTALLLIDMQWGFLDAESSLCVAGAVQTVGTCARVLEAARACGMPVIHVRRRYSFDGGDVEPVRLETWLAGGRPLCPEGDRPDSVEVPPALDELPGEPVLWKPRFSAFFSTELDRMLRRRAIEAVALIGTTTPNCIRATCYDALSLNYEVVIVEDATSSRTPEVQRANIADMEFIGARIVTAREFVAACDRCVALSTNCAAFRKRKPVS